MHRSGQLLHCTGNAKLRLGSDGCVDANPVANFPSITTPPEIWLGGTIPFGWIVSKPQLIPSLLLTL